ncbi:MAG: polyprenyl diphosphate synthase [Conexivisphaerales archaeon]
MKLDRFVRAVSRVLLIDRLYERILENEIERGPFPRHVGVIMDGNRRWASTKGLAANIGYTFGADVAENFLRWCLKYGIKTVTLYALSVDNIRKRNQDDLDAIYDSILEKLKSLENSGLIQQHGIMVNAIGDINMLPDSLKEQVYKLEEMSRANSKMYLNLALAYSGRKEIIQAARKIAIDVKDGKISADAINESSFMSYLTTAKIDNPEPDLIIRTSGEMRLSDFMIYQSSYSEMIFIDEFWPELRKIDFLRAIRTYEERNRRYGK